MGFVLFKISTTLAVVLGIAWATERFGEKVGATLTGFPNTQSLVMLFYGLAYGSDFVAATIPSALAFLSLVLLFGAAWGFAAQRFKTLIIAPAIALIIYAAAALFMLPFEYTFPGGVIIAAVSICFFWVVMKRFPDNPLKSKPMKYSELIFRTLFVVATILIVTESAEFLGPQYAGLFSVFPINLFPLLFILQRHYGANAVTTLLHHWPPRLFAVLSFLVVLMILLPLAPFLVAWSLAMLAAVLASATVMLCRL